MTWDMLARYLDTLAERDDPFMMPKPAELPRTCRELCGHRLGGKLQHGPNGRWYCYGARGHVRPGVCAFPPDGAAEAKGRIDG